MKHRITFEVEGWKNYATVMEVLEGTATYVKQELIDNEPSRPHKKVVRYVNGKRLKSVSSRELALTILAKGPATFEQVENHFAAQNFARSTTGPALNALVREGRLLRVVDSRGTRTYSLKESKSNV